MIEQLIIDIENTSDLEVLIPILKERKLKFRSNEVQQISDDEKALLRASILEKVKNGEFDTPNIRKMIRDFDVNRQDRPMPGRD